MSAIETLESVAELLPEAQRERFLKLVARFRSVPEDDEYLAILEAIGFMTLLWREVPDEIRGIIENAKSPTETVQGLGATVRNSVIEVIPSYDDLKKISQRLESHELALKNTLSERSRTPQLHHSGFWAATMFALGFLGGIAANEYFFPLLP